MKEPSQTQTKGDDALSEHHFLFFRSSEALLSLWFKKHAWLQIIADN